ncbi:MAG: hypothetical protein ACLR02_02005 [Clostridium sp.]|nr:hypothetical protein [Clostridium sp.]
MRYFVIGLIFFLIIVNFSLFFIGRKHASNISENKEASDKEFKKGMKYFIAAAVVSFLTIIIISVAAILYIR